MKKTSDIIWQDAQHQELFKLIDQLKSEALSSDIFRRLDNYAENHFLLEEEYMSQLNYPDMASHILAHNSFRKELKEMVRTQGEFNEETKNSISIFLTEWLTRHILRVDKKLEQFVLDSEYK